MERPDAVIVRAADAGGAVVIRTVGQMLVWLDSAAFLRTVDVRLPLVEDSPVLRTRGRSDI